MDSRRLHTTATGDSPEARESKLASEREVWRIEARAIEASWSEEWVILTTFRRTGDKAFWSETGRSPYPGNALRYATKDLARGVAEDLLARDVIDGYSLEGRKRRSGGLRSRGA